MRQMIVICLSFNTSLCACVLRAFSLQKSQEALQEIATLLHVHVELMQLKLKVQK